MDNETTQFLAVVFCTLAAVLFLINAIKYRIEDNDIGATCSAMSCTGFVLLVLFNLGVL